MQNMTVLQTSEKLAEISVPGEITTKNDEDAKKKS